MHDEQTIQDLIAKYAAGEASPEEAMQVEAWADESAQNKAYLEGCFQIYDLSNKEFDGDVKINSWKNIEAEITTTHNVFVKRRGLWRMGIAASLLVVAGLGYFLAKRMQAIEMPLVFEATATPKKVRLQDGTEIMLSPYAKASLDKNYGDTSRAIALQGAATFFVKHDQTKPFVVTIDGLHIKDIGTRFTVTTLQDVNEVRIAVLEGVVFVFNDRGKSILLKADETGSYEKASGSLLVFQKPSIDSSVIKRTKNKAVQDSETKGFNIHEEGASDLVLANVDTVVTFSFEDVEKVLGGPVALTNNNKNKNDGLVKYNQQFRALSDPATNLSFDIEYFVDEPSAQKMFELLRSKYASSKEVAALRETGAQAFDTANETSSYFIALRKTNVLITVKISKTNLGVSTNALLQILKRKAQAMR